MTHWKLTIYCKLQNSTRHKNNDQLNEEHSIALCAPHTNFPRIFSFDLLNKSSFVLPR